MQQAQRVLRNRGWPITSQLHNSFRLQFGRDGSVSTLLLNLYFKQTICDLCRAEGILSLPSAAKPRSLANMLAAGAVPSFGLSFKDLSSSPFVPRHQRQNKSKLLSTRWLIFPKYWLPWHSFIFWRLWNIVFFWICLGCSWNFTMCQFSRVAIGLQVTIWALQQTGGIEFLQPGTSRRLFVWSTS